MHKLPHPATMWPTRWIFHDRKDEEPILQAVDILTDIRNLLLVLVILSFF